MKVAFVSNYYNHHQASFSNTMINLTDGQYWFIATEKMDEERIKLGWGDEKCFPFIIPAYKNNNYLNMAKKVIDNADVVIYGLNGWKNFQLIGNRLKKNKLTFQYTERIYKQEICWYKLPIQALKLWLVGGRYSSMYLLCASAYTSYDYARTRCYLEKAYKWGYFPEFRKYDIEELMQKKVSSGKSEVGEKIVSILWAGRLIGWKHPEAPIKLADSLKKKGYHFRMSIIGTGEMQQQLYDMISEADLKDCVEILGSMTPNEVRSYMEKADIYLFTSDFNEGWGAVLNESMNSGCAVVASHAIGSVPFLINSGENGLVYRNGDQEHFEQQVKKLLDDPSYRKMLGKKAYHTICTMWNAELAASRLIKLCESILEGNKNANLYASGPCSKAQIVNEDWFYE